jgi:glyoxylase-like metal-dependent hydrolase (beta-lactamase superfamily II)
MSLVTRFQVGGLHCYALEGGLQRLDGGAMFGVVPKTLWEREIPADQRNRIPLALRCLLIEHRAGPVLVDTGLGNKESDKFKMIYGVENSGRKGPTQLEDALAEAGFAPGDVRYVINTHLHFDHAGGNTCIDEGDGRTGGQADGFSGAGTASQSNRQPVRLSFPNATYIVDRRELEFATNTNERIAASYLSHNFAPVTAAGRWRLVEGPGEVLPGIRLVHTPGHVPYHESVVVADRGETACFLGDVVPTAAHLPLPWIMGYDLEPLVTLESKRKLLAQAEGEGWLLVFEHDPTRAIGRVRRDGKAYRYAPLDSPSGAA